MVMFPAKPKPTYGRNLRNWRNFRNWRNLRNWRNFRNRNFRNLKKESSAHFITPSFFLLIKIHQSHEQRMDRIGLDTLYSYNQIYLRGSDMIQSTNKNLEYHRFLRL